MKSMKNLFSIAAILSLGLLAGTSRLLAQATWNGTDGADWNVAGNWLGSAPVNGGTSALVFSGTANLTSTNSLTNLTVSSLTFASGGRDNTLNGNAITLSGDLLDSTGNWQTINLSMGLTGNRTFAINSGQLTINGNLSDGTSAGGILKTGGSWLYLTGSSSLSGVTTLAINGGPGVGTYYQTLAFNASNAGNVILRNTAALGSGTNKFVQFNTGGGGALDLQTDTSVNQYSINIGSNTNTNNIIIANRLTSGTGIIHNLGVLNMGSATITINPGGNVTSGTAGVSFTALSMSAGNNDRPVTIVANAAVTIGSAGNTNNTNNNRRLQLDGTSAGSSIGQIVNVASGAPAGTGTTSLIKANTGTWTLTGTNTYTGTTTVNTNGGTLLFSKTAALYNSGTASWTASNITVNSGGTLALRVGGIDEFTSDHVQALTALGSGSNGFLAGSSIGLDTTNAGGNFDYGNVLANPNSGSNALGLTKLGNGTLTLTASNTYTGTTTVNGGTLKAGVATSAFGNNSAVKFANVSGAILDSSGFDNTIGSLTGGGTTGGNVVIDNATLTVGGDNTSPAGYAGVISGSSGALIKTGTGTLNFSGKNTYNGGTTVNGGTLQLSTGGASGAVRGALTVNSGGTILSTTGDSMGYNTGTKVDTINIVGGTLTHNSSSNLTLSSAVINLTGGTMQSTSSGGFDIYDNGTGNTAINTLASATTSTIAGKLNLRAGDNDTTGTVFTVADGAAATDLLVGATITNGASGQSANSVVQKAGAGLMVLSASNSYTGGTILTGGMIVAQNANALGAAGSSFRFSAGTPTSTSGVLDLQTDASFNSLNIASGAFNGGTILADRATPGATITHALGIADLSSVTLTINKGSNVSGAAFVSFSEVRMSGGNDNNPVTIAGDATLTIGSASITASGMSKRLQLDGTGFSNTVTGTISDTNNATANAKVNLIKANTSTWTLTGTNTYTGSTTINGGTLAAGSTQAFGVDSAVSFANVSGATLDLAGFSQSIGSLTGGGANGGTVSLGSTTLTVGSDNTSPAAFAGSITGSGGVLLKTGTGRLTLSGSSSYTGGTVINGGAVAVSSNSSLGDSSGGVTLAGGALSAIGNVSAFSHIIDTGTTGGGIELAPGSSLQVNNYNSNSASITGSGPITVQGGGKLTLSATATAGTYSGNWTVNAGRVEVQVSGGLGSGSVTLASGAELVNSWSNTISNSIVSDGGILSYDNSGGGVYSGPVSLSSGTTTVSLKDFYGGTARDGSITGLISGTGALAVSGNGTSGTLTLQGNNSYTGGTTINSGVTVRLNSGNSGAGVIRGTVNVNSGGTLLSTVHDSFGYNEGSQLKTLNIDGGTVTHSSNDTLTLASAAVIMTGGTMQTTGGSNSGFDFYNNGSGNTGVTTLASSGTATIAGKINLRNGDGATTTFEVADGAAETDLLVSAAIGNGLAEGANSAITKTGDGFMLLSGSNTYTGLTTVSAGTLGFDVSETLLGGLDIATSGTAVLTAHSGGAGNVKVLDISSLTISGTTPFVGGGAKAGNNIAAGFASPVPVPEPGTWAMLLSGLGVLGACRKVRRWKE